MRWIPGLATVFVLLCAAGEIRAGLEGDLIAVEWHRPTLGQNIIDLGEIVVRDGDADAIPFAGSGSINVDPDAITVTMACNHPLATCFFNVSTSHEFIGLVFTGLDWSTPPGPPLELVVDEAVGFFDPSRVVVRPGRIEINLDLHVFRAGSIRLVPVYSPQVAIDVLPRDADNVVRNTRKGRIPVALLGSEELDVRGVDPFSLRFAPGEATASWRLWFPIWRIAEGDINGDGYLDLVYSFDARQAAIPADATEVCLSGEFEGLPFESCDAVEVRPRGRHASSPEPLR